VGRGWWRVCVWPYPLRLMNSVHTYADFGHYTLAPQKLTGSKAEVSKFPLV